MGVVAKGVTAASNSRIWSSWLGLRPGNRRIGWSPPGSAPLAMMPVARRSSNANAARLPATLIARSCNSGM